MNYVKLVALSAALLLVPAAQAAQPAAPAAPGKTWSELGWEWAPTKSNLQAGNKKAIGLLTAAVVASAVAADRFVPGFRKNVTNPVVNWLGARAQELRDGNKTTWAGAVGLAVIAYLVYDKCTTVTLDGKLAQIANGIKDTNKYAFESDAVTAADNEFKALAADAPADVKKAATDKLAAAQKALADAKKATADVLGKQKDDVLAYGKLIAKDDAKDEAFASFVTRSARGAADALKPKPAANNP